MKDFFLSKQRRAAKEATEKKLSEASERKEKVVLEKGDLPAILIAAFFNFVPPIMLVCTAICLITYFVLMGFK